MTFPPILVMYKENLILHININSSRGYCLPSTIQRIKLK